MAITGNVIFSPELITFSNGRSLPLAALEKRHDFRGNGRMVDAVIYRITAPADPTLRAGNRLCSGGAHPRVPATFIAVWKPAPAAGLDDTAARSMAVYSGTKIPASDRDPSSCGTFNYDAGTADR